MKKGPSLEFTPTFFWEDLTYVLELIGKFFKWLFGLADKDDEPVEDPADGE